MVSKPMAASTSASVLAAALSNDASLTVPVRGSATVMPLALLISAGLTVCIVMPVPATAKQHRSASDRSQLLLLPEAVDD